MSSRSSYNNPQFKPFQSGNSLCYPSKDYANFKGGNNSLIKTTLGKNLYKENNLNVSKESLKSLSGKSYATSAGGAKKKVKKGGSLSGAPIKENKALGDSISSHGLCGPAPVGQKGGKKRTMKKKGGNSPVQEESVLSGGKKRTMKKKGGNSLVDEESSTVLNNIMNKIGGESPVQEESVLSGGKKNKSKPKAKTTKPKATKPKATKSKATKPKAKKMKGGKESEGATGMPSEFYNGKKSMGYPANSGKGVNTPYGVIDPTDVGVGNLAPYNTSKSSPGNSMMKTGGSGKIPRLNDGAFHFVNKVVNKGTGELAKFFKKLEQNYQASVQKSNNARNGLARLAGGAKKNKKNKKSLKGGDGSDFAATLNSRGPANYPDSGEKMFRQFNKTGTYIPNSQLSKAAAPKLTGGPKVDKVSGFSTFESTYAPLTGGKKAAKKPKKKAPAKKPVKKAPAKKPKKKTASKKKC